MRYGQRYIEELCGGDVLELSNTFGRENVCEEVGVWRPEEVRWLLSGWFGRDGGIKSGTGECGLSEIEEELTGRKVEMAAEACREAMEQKKKQMLNLEEEECKVGGVENCVVWFVWKAYKVIHNLWNKK